MTIFGLIATVLLAWWQLDQSADLNRKQLDQSDQVKLAQIYSEAVGQLASDQTSVQVGAVYSLIRVEHESAGVDRDPAASYHSAVVSLLAAHVRSRSLSQLDEKTGLCKSPVPLVDKPEFADFRAAIEAIRTLAKPGDRVNLSFTCLLWADLHGMHLEDAVLNSADMRSARFDDADLTGADIRYTRLEYTSWERAKLTRAQLTGSNFNCASGSGVDLTGAVVVDSTGKVVLSADKVNFPGAAGAPEPLNHAWSSAEKDACKLS
ncbi:pentapeptide repeat-containing protein [Catellatospora sp. TT07R-123]|uniref:pentapeptide repeat-containing protein n=1 Tax=Catellatospora sp. TT07R-123 TaxID=2733863 RepID=UPI001BB402DA|nr:pentapeptide repeat-containing protein [Catellatospora sp. TT07R-123]